MTTDEFERIIIAVNTMQGWNINGARHVPADSVLKVVYSQMHPDDKAHWGYNPQTGDWVKKNDA